MRSSRIHSRALRFLLTAVLALSAGVLWGTAPCGPFLDMSSGDPFCPFVLEVFTLGITTGTTSTTYSPSDNVTRLQMAAFLARSVDRVLRRGSRRAALGQFWTPQTANAVTFGARLTTYTSPSRILSDGTDIWVQAESGISRVRASDGMILSNLPTIGSSGLLVAMGKVFFTEFVLFVGGALVALDPTSNTLTDMIPVPNPATSLTFDGSRIFGPDGSGSGSVTIVTLTPMFQNATVATVTTGFTQPWGTVFDGANVWVTDLSTGTLLKLDASGAILQTVTVGRAPSFPAFDGTNIWVPNSSYLSNSVSVVRASSGAVLATLTGNGIASPASAAFDGERILLTNQFDGTVSLFKAADLTPLGSVSTGGGFPYGACSDGVNFWVTLQTANRIVRF